MEMDESGASHGTKARSFQFTHLFALHKPEGEEPPHWVTSFRMACMLSFPAWFILPTNSSAAGLLSCLAILLVVGYCSCYSCKLIVSNAISREKSVVDTISRLLGRNYRSCFLVLGGLHFITVGSLFLREST